MSHKDDENKVSAPDVDFILAEIDWVEEAVKVLSKKSFHEDRELQDSIESLWDAIYQIYLAVPSLKYRINHFGKLDDRKQLDGD